MLHLILTAPQKVVLLTAEAQRHREKRFNMCFLASPRLSGGFLVFTILPIVVFSLLLIQPSRVEAGTAPNAEKGHPYYWKAMIGSMPQEEIPEAPFEEREYGNSEAALFFKKATAFFREKSYPKAVEQLKEIVARFPKDDITSYAYYFMGDCYAKMAEDKGGVFLNESVAKYLTAVRTYPDSFEAPRGLYQAGRGLFIQGFYYEAAAQMDRLTSNYPKSRYADKGMVAKGIIYFYQKKYGMSESALRRVINKSDVADEDKRLGKLWLANSLHADGRYTEARDLYKTTEREWPEYLKKNKLSSLLMGENLLILGYSEDSRVAFGIYLKNFPGSPEAPAVMLRIGDSLRLDGRKGEAFKLYSTVVSKYPSAEPAIIGKARVSEIEIEKGNTAPGTLLFQEMLSLKGDMAKEAALIIADAFKKAGIQDEAVKGYKAVLVSFSANPGDVETKGKLTESLKDVIKESYNKKDYLGVLKTYHQEPSLLKRVREPQFLKMIGDSYMEVGLHSEAGSVYEELLSSRNPGDSKGLHRSFWEETLFKSVETQIKAGNKEEAGKKIKQLLTEFPKSRFKEKVLGYSGEIKGDIKQGGTAKGHLEMAKKSLEKSRFKEAAGYYNEAIELKDPASLATAYIGLGDSCYGMERYREAIDAYETGKAAGGEMGHWAGYRIGESYLNLGEAEKAMAAFQAIAREDKGIYGKMAAEELKKVEMNAKNPGKVDWDTWGAKPAGSVHLGKSN